MIMVTLIFPILGAIFSGFFGFYVGRLGSVHITLFCMFLTTLSSLFFLLHTSLLNETYYINCGPWISTGLFLVEWGFLFDTITIFMLFMISIISSVVHIYSSGYMLNDPHLSRFMSYLSLFTFFMFVLITSDNFIQLFLGWEGVGICSYLLINFWFTRIQANKSALKALIINRIGDFGLLIGILLIFLFFKSVDFATIFVLAPYFCQSTFSVFKLEFQTLSLICTFLFIGSVGKSAQIGLHVWLPDAMEGPTPVSALIHAATMVTAGIFLIIRCSPLFEYAPNTLLAVTIIGSLTAFFSSTIGLVQNDLKKVIAYSTASQLGYMIFSCGLSAYHISFFHLINHAFFKALLFLGSGVIIHGLNNEQDMRKMGGLIKLFPFTYSCILIGSLALGGFPFLSGFYSKDIILELAYIKFKTQGLFAFTLGSISAFITAFYSTRLIYLTFGGKSHIYRYNSLIIHEGESMITLPLVFLVTGSIFTGFFLKDVFVGFGSVFFSNAIFILAVNSAHYDVEFIPIWIKLIPTALGLVGFIFAFITYSCWIAPTINCTTVRVYTFFSNKWFFDAVYNSKLGNYISQISYTTCYKLIDKGFLEYFGPSGISLLIYKVSNKNLRFQTGLVHNYIYILILNWLLLIFLFEISL